MNRSAGRCRGSSGRRQKDRRIGVDFLVQLGWLAILWGDMEALTRTLQLMKGRGLRYRAKTEEELKREYRKGETFEKRLKTVLPHQTGMAQGILTLKELRDFALHGAVVKWRSQSGETDAIIHADGPATIFAQDGFLSRPLQMVVPRAGMVDGDGQPEAAILATDGLRRACDRLAGYVYDLRLFRTIFQVKQGEAVRLEVWGGGRKRCRADGDGAAEESPRFPRTIEQSVFQNPADEIGHDTGTAKLVGEFCRSFSLLDQTIRTLEIMRGERPGEYRAHDDPETGAWYSEPSRPLTARLNFVLGKDSKGVRALSDLVKFRNFVYHNPISLMGSGDVGEGAAFVHRDLVALRDARPRADAEKNQARPVPDWAVRQHKGTTHMPVGQLAVRTREATLWQEHLLGLVQQGHR